MKKILKKRKWNIEMGGQTNKLKRNGSKSIKGRTSTTRHILMRLLQWSSGDQQRSPTCIPYSASVSTIVINRIPTLYLLAHILTILLYKEAFVTAFWLDKSLLRYTHRLPSQLLMVMVVSWCTISSIKLHLKHFILISYFPGRVYNKTLH